MGPVRGGFDLEIGVGNRLGPVLSFAVAGKVWTCKIGLMENSSVG